MTIKELAQRVGVSSAMISRYLNNGYVSEENRAKIAKAIQETGFRPSQQARSLRSGKTQLVGMVVPRISTSTIGRVTAGVEEVTQQHGYQMLLANTENDAQKELDYLQLFERYPVDGIVLVGTMVTPAHLAFFKKAAVPLVVVGQRVDGVNCVYHDDRNAAFELGRRVAAARPGGEVALVTVTREDHAIGVERREGLEAGLRAGGVEVPDRLMRQVGFDPADGYCAARELLKACPEGRLDAICCATDVIAAGAMKAVFERYGEPAGHGRAPLVTGFGDNELAQAVSGGFPTVHLGYRTSGVRGAEALLSLIKNPRTMPASTMLGYRILGI